MAKKTTSGRRSLSSRDLRDLDIEIGFLEGVVRRDPGYVDALRLLGDDYTLRGRHVEGLSIDEQLARLRPEDPCVLYNLACSYSLTGRIEAAAEAIQRALDLGYRNFRWLRRDPDLRALRRHRLFKPLRERIRAMELGAAA